jgi:DNA-binding phage protein
MPATTRELFLVNRNALGVFREMSAIAKSAGFTQKEFQHAVSKAHP